VVRGLDRRRGHGSLFVDSRAVRIPEADATATDVRRAPRRAGHRQRSFMERCGLWGSLTGRDVSVLRTGSVFVVAVVSDDMAS
jgi:hypothetical protein